MFLVVEILLTSFWKFVSHIQLHLCNVFNKPVMGFLFSPIYSSSKTALLFPLVTEFFYQIHPKRQVNKSTPSSAS